MSTVQKIVYITEGKESIDKLEKSLSELNKENEVTQKEVNKTNEKLAQQEKQTGLSTKALVSMSDQLKMAGNRVNVFGVGLGDMASNLGKVSIGTGGFIKKLKLLKVAIVSTGVGALVLALGSLVTFFTKTQRGADMVSKAMAGISAGVSAPIDRDWETLLYLC